MMFSGAPGHGRAASGPQFFTPCPTPSGSRPWRNSRTNGSLTTTAGEASVRRSSSVKSAPDNRQAHRREVADTRWCPPPSWPRRLRAASPGTPALSAERRRARKAAEHAGWPRCGPTGRDTSGRGSAQAGRSLAAPARLQRRDDHALEIDRALVMIQILQRPANRPAPTSETTDSATWTMTRRSGPTPAPAGRVRPRSRVP